MLSWEWEPSSTTNHLDYSRPVKSKTENMREYNRIYREKHSSYMQCGCGAEFKEISKYTHVKTARHLKWLQNKAGV
jgi:hypothetical protein